MKDKTPLEWILDRIQDVDLTEQMWEQIKMDALTKQSEQSKALKDKLERIDDGLSWLEDFCHGRVGEKVSELRNLIQTELDLYGK